MVLPKAGYSARYSCWDRLTILLIDRSVGLRLSMLLQEGKGLQVSSLTENFYSEPPARCIYQHALGTWALTSPMARPQVPKCGGLVPVSEP